MIDSTEACRSTARRCGSGAASRPVLQIVEALGTHRYNARMLLGKRIAFIGAGSMTEALVTGMLASRLASPNELYATDIQAARRQHMEHRYRVRVGADNREAAGWADVVLVSVEPDDLDAVLGEIRPALHPECVLISVAAGYPIARIAAHVKPDCAIVRAMPNTPSTVLAGMTALAFGGRRAESTEALAKRLFESVGSVVVVEEALMDAATGVSGSGPAYVYVMIEALADGGVRMGLPRSTAQLLAAQTVRGAAKMLIETGQHRGELKERVASPGGTTLAGLEELETGRFRAALISAVEAAVTRSAEVGKEQGTV